jgi:hypothetical protein
VLFQISGTPACVERAKAAVEERCRELEAERQDRILKSFELKVRDMFTDFILIEKEKYMLLVLYVDSILCKTEIHIMMSVCSDVTPHCLVEM